VRYIVSKVKLLFFTTVVFLLLSAYLGFKLIQPPTTSNDTGVSRYESGSREACLDEIRVDVNNVFAEIIDDACSSNYLDPMCEARMRGLIKNRLTKDVDNCIKSTKP